MGAKTEWLWPATPPPASPLPSPGQIGHWRERTGSRQGLGLPCAPRPESQATISGPRVLTPLPHVASKQLRWPQAACGLVLLCPVPSSLSRGPLACPQKGPHGFKRSAPHSHQESYPAQCHMVPKVLLTPKLPGGARAPCSPGSPARLVDKAVAASLLCTRRRPPAPGVTPALPFPAPDSDWRLGTLRNRRGPDLPAQALGPAVSRSRAPPTWVTLDPTAHRCPPPRSGGSLCPHRPRRVFGEPLGPQHQTQGEVRGAQGAAFPEEHPTDFGGHLLCELRKEGLELHSEHQASVQLLGSPAPTRHFGLRGPLLRKRR